MTLAESTAAAVLPRKANAMSFREQAAERHRFCRRPVEPFAAVEHRLLGVENPLQRLVDRETSRNLGQNRAKAAHLIVADRRWDVAAPKHRLVGPPEPSPAAFEPVGLVRRISQGPL